MTQDWHKIWKKLIKTIKYDVRDHHLIWSLWPIKIGNSNFLASLLFSEHKHLWYSQKIMLNFWTVRVWTVISEKFDWMSELQEIKQAINEPINDLAFHQLHQGYFGFRASTWNTYSCRLTAYTLLLVWLTESESLKTVVNLRGTARYMPHNPPFAYASQLHQLSGLSLVRYRHRLRQVGMQAAAEPCTARRGTGYSDGLKTRWCQLRSSLRHFLDFLVIKTHSHCGWCHTTPHWRICSATEDAADFICSLFYALKRTQTAAFVRCRTTSHSAFRRDATKTEKIQKIPF